MNRALRFLYLFSSVLFIPLLLQAQQKNLPYTIGIRSESIIPQVNAQAWLDSMNSTGISGPVQVIVQFYDLPTAATRQQLRSVGIELMDYLPQLSYITVIHFPLQSLDAAALGIRSFVPVQPAWKIEGPVLQQLASGRALKLLVSFNKSVSASDIATMVAAIGGRITDKRFAPFNRYEVTMAANKITALAALPLVRSIGFSADIQPLNFDERASSGAALLSEVSATGGYSLEGRGVTLGVGDNASGITHVDVRDRLLNFHPGVPSMHGVHTTTTASGKGIMDPRTEGMAPSVNVLAHIYDVVWIQTPVMFSDYNMTVTNNSYASVVSDCSYAGTYDQYAQMLDELHIDYPFVQHVFAAGNDGLMQCGNYPVSYHTVNGGYQPSKNILTVGGMAKDNIIWPKSSSGPVNDGRLKPEIMAYGFSVYSGDIADGYGHSNGTSMSCPAVAGGLTLIEERYKQLHGNQNAPASLLKTLAMNGATDVGNPGPDFQHGYGLLNLYRSIQMLDNNHYRVDTVSHNGEKTYTISVPPGTSKLKVMVYWPDEAASPLATSTLINNLDLKLTDPAAAIRLPLILDTAAANVTNPAQPGVDIRNNSEQVVITNPPAGNYTISVKGTLVPSGTQPFVVAYDFLPNDIKVKFPVSGEPVPGSDSVRVYWDAPEDPNSFTIEYSANNGGSWTTVSNNVPGTQRQFVWYTPSAVTAQGLLRISRNNASQSNTAGPFVVNPQPVVTLSATQCPGYMAIDWSAVPGVSGYEVLQKMGDDLRPVDTVTNTSYVFSGLSFDSLYYAGVRPLVSGVRGWRSKSVKRTPNDGSCSGSISNGDLVAAVVSPGNGRLLTSSALTASDTLVVRVRNLDDAPASNYRVSYSLNGGGWQSQALATPIAPGGEVLVNFPGLNLAAAGTYQFRVAVENLAMIDPVRTNDSVSHAIRQLTNPPVDLTASFYDGFEGAPVLTVMRDSMGILPGDHWDFSNDIDSGRIRNFVSSDILITGQRSLSMDLLTYQPDNQNYLTGTFNLQAYNAATTEARVEFDYKIHGQPKFWDGNEVWVRGSDTDPWRLVYRFDTSATPGQKINTGSLSITNALAGAAQSFSSSLQVRIGQHDTSVIAMNEYGNGITIDNFKLYSVKNDVQLLSIVNPARLNCGLDSAVVSIMIYNSDNLPQDTVELFYRMDNGPLVRDTLFFIAARDTVIHHFSRPAAIAAHGTHTLDAWLVAQGDSYLPNDSILNYELRNQPFINTFPYLQDFEGSDGSWFAQGFNSSWQYGVPNSARVKKAASGSRVWATGLTGNYNDNEASYLYSPCFDLWGLTNPMLSFSLSTDIENCGSTICDAAIVEYSEDGIQWTRLGASGQGFNWYGPLQAWHDTGSRWRVASMALPTGVSSLKLRFVFTSDAGAARDGIAIDDIHIFDLKYPVYEGPSAAGTGPAAVQGSWQPFVSNNAVMVEAYHGLPTTISWQASVFKHSYVLHPLFHQYYLSRNYVFNRTLNSGDTQLLRLYITDAEVVQLINDKGCDTCSRAEDAYRLGIIQYTDADKAKENGSLGDNTTGTYRFIPYSDIKWVPYERGYYAELRLTELSEFWFGTELPGQPGINTLLYPNPVFDDRIHIVWSAEPGTEMWLQLFDASGRVVAKTTALASDYDNRTTLELPGLAPGVYIVRYSVAGQVTTTKLLVQ